MLFCIKQSALVFFSLLILCTSSCSSQTIESKNESIEPHILVIFGATGDLTQRKLIPALYQLSLKGQLPSHFICVGIGRRDKTDAQFRQEALSAIKADQDFQERFVYFKGDFENPDDYDRLSAFLAELGGKQGNRLFYLATPASAFPVITDQLHHHQLLAGARVVIEKPFGHDLPSAVALQEQIARNLDESQIYRIDHYLGKAVVQAILPFRIAHPELLLDRQHVEKVEVTLSEELGVGTRGNLFEESGLLRDLVQNHVMQLVALIAMEPPAALTPQAIQDEKVKLVEAIRPFEEGDITRGQYGPGVIKGQEVPGYRQENQVAKNSPVETFVSARLAIDNDRWSGVPFYLKAGKRLDKSLVEIVITFKSSDTLIFRLQPDPEIYLVKDGKKWVLDASFSHAPDAYETLLLASMRGDASLFVGIQELLATWSLFTPVLNYWKEHPPLDFPNYPAGTAGPAVTPAIEVYAGN